MEPEYREMGYQLEAVETLPPLAQKTQDREGTARMSAGRTQEFLFKVFYILCEVKDQAVCVERKGQSEREVEGDGQSRLEKYKGNLPTASNGDSGRRRGEKKSYWLGWRVRMLRSVGRVMTT